MFPIMPVNVFKSTFIFIINERQNSQRYPALYLDPYYKYYIPIRYGSLVLDILSDI
jgi:hypothetical protein